jgi:hypothetical protein
MTKPPSMSQTTCDIVIRSYWRDFDWLEWCLASIGRFCTGFRDVVLILPQASQPWLSRHPCLQTPSRLVVCPDYADDYLGQQVSKMYADTVTDADLICHVDSDCIFQRPTSPEDLAPGGKPRVFTRPVDELPRTRPWIASTEEFLRSRPSHDFMQQPPFTFPSWLYAELRTWSRTTHGVELADWILARPARGFSEFNVLGAFAYTHHRDAFIWTRIADIGAEEPVCRWYWSWGRIDNATSHELRARLG